MADIQLYTNEKFGEIRTTVIDGEPWFVGKDVALALGYADTKSALADHVDGEDKTLIQRGQNATFEIPNRGLTFINESGLYSLVLSSKLPSAKAFKRWITHEVIPAIRKTGTYNLNLPKDYPSALRALADSYEREIALKEQNAVLLPKASFADAVSNAANLVPMAELSAYLYKNGVKIGRNKLMCRLREEGYLYKDGAGHNLPTQKAKDLGLLDVKQGHYLNGGESIATTTTYVTGKGKEYFMRRFGAVKETKMG